MTTRTTASTMLIAGLCLALPGCSKEEPEAAPPPLDSSYLESLEEDTPRQKAPPPKPAPEPADDPEPDSQVAEEEPAREFRAQRESQSTLGRTRDMARDTRNQLSGGATTNSKLASTGYDEHWIEVRDFHWDVPEAWDIAIPSNPQIKGELVIQTEMGNASALFYEVSGDPNSALRQIGSTMLDELGSAQRPRPIREEINGTTVHRISISGTYVDPVNRSAREQPFWSLRAIAIAIDERTTLVATLRGPQMTVERNDDMWDEMIEGMSDK